jgi:glycerate 2-kinase
MATQQQLRPDPQPDYIHGRQLAQRIFMEAMASIDVRRAMLRKLRFAGGNLTVGELEIEVLKPPRVIAFGKAATRMAAVLNELLGGWIEAGVVVTLAGPARTLDRFQQFVGGHPYPSRGSLEGAAAALKLVSNLTPDDLVIFLVSGGGSAVCEQPLDPAITLADLAEFYRVLVTSDLPIEEINVLRKHLSAVKGGRLALAAFPARQVTIFISDVPDNASSMVASGPTMADESTCAQCYALAGQHNLAEKFPEHIRKYFTGQTLEETPKPGDARFGNSEYFCLLSNRDAVNAALAAASALGFAADRSPGIWDGPYAEVVDAALAGLDEAVRARPGTPVCLVTGGEVTCPLTGHGIGGRNLSLALYAAQKIEGRRRVVLSAATDGRDGNSPSSGAVANGQTVSRARALGLEPSLFLARSDAYHFFRTLGDTIETGFTENNVRDLRLFMSFE